MTHRDGKIVAALELHFESKIVFVNAHVFIDNDYRSINIFNTDKLLEFAQ
jgi:hypothetical protein